MAEPASLAVVALVWPVAGFGMVGRVVMVVAGLWLSLRHRLWPVAGFGVVGRVSMAVVRLVS